LRPCGKPCSAAAWTLACACWGTPAIACGSAPEEVASISPRASSPALPIAKDGQTQVFLKTVTRDENAHVAFLKKALGSKAIAAPKVDFGATTSSEASFIKTAVALENTGVHAYSGQALNIASPAYIAAALSIWSIEARHASVAGLLLTGKPSGITPDGPFDTPFTAVEVLKAVKKTGFLK
jgi:hypothetical protein